MTKQYKLVLLDLDGTTVASKGHALPSKRVVDTVQKAQKHVHVSLATGRPLGLAQPVIDVLKLHGPSVLNGGSELIDLTTGEVIHQELLDVEDMRELFKLIYPFGYKFGYRVYTADDQYEKQVGSAEDIKVPCAKLFIEAVDSSRLPDILSELEAVSNASAHPTTSWTDGDVVDIHVTHKHATKRYGVERLIKHMGLKRDDVLAIGDGHNDIPMMEAAGTKVAMGNAPDEVKAVADFVTASLDKDGVAIALEKFILKA